MKIPERVLPKLRPEETQYFYDMNKLVAVRVTPPSLTHPGELDILEETFDWTYEGVLRKLRGHYGHCWNNDDNYDLLHGPWRIAKVKNITLETPKRLLTASFIEREIRRVARTPRNRLPLLIGTLDSKEAQKLLEKRLKNS